MEFTVPRAFLAAGCAIVFCFIGVGFCARYNNSFITTLSLPLIFFCATMLGIGVAWAVSRKPEMLATRDPNERREIV